MRRITGFKQSHGFTRTTTLPTFEVVPHEVVVTYRPRAKTIVVPEQDAPLILTEQLLLRYRAYVRTNASRICTNATP